MNETPTGEPAGADRTAERTLDGNAVTGALAELFAVDLVPADCTCAHCGRTGPLAEHELYADSPALVLRCPGCTGVVLRYSSSGGRIRLDMSGTRLLVLRLPEQPLT
jgi:hypothetical protein